MQLDVKTSALAGYDDDFVLWTQQQAALLRSRNGAGIDWENVAEEIESLGRSDYRQLANRLKVLVMHLLKWQLQTEHRSGSWGATINVQRRDIEDLLSESPSLRRHVSALCTEVYRRAISDAMAETGLPATHFPSTMPFAPDDVMADGWFPHSRTDRATLSRLEEAPGQEPE